ncbi:hypothetical protein LA080_000432 [Diaporthe eres]|nr:hypothetical protein LA080_000432 [Diaporthe eres]
MAGHCEQQTSTARTKRANSAGPGKEVAAADPIDIDRGQSCPGQEGAAQQAQESAHVAQPSRVLGYLPWEDPSSSSCPLSATVCYVRYDYEVWVLAPQPASVIVIVGVGAGVQVRMLQVQAQVPQRQCPWDCLGLRTPRTARSSRTAASLPPAASAPASASHQHFLRANLLTDCMALTAEDSRLQLDCARDHDCSCDYDCDNRLRSWLRGSSIEGRGSRVEAEGDEENKGQATTSHAHSDTYRSPSPGVATYAHIGRCLLGFRQVRWDPIMIHSQRRSHFLILPIATWSSSEHRFGSAATSKLPRALQRVRHRPGTTHSWARSPVAAGQARPDTRHQPPATSQLSLQHGARVVPRAASAPSLA